MSATAPLLADASPLQRVADSVVGWLAAASWQLALLIAIVTAAAWLLRGASPRLRHGLWLLVLVKAVTPTTLAFDWSIGPLAIRPVTERVVGSLDFRPADAGLFVRRPTPAAASADSRPTPPPGPLGSIDTTAALALIWAGGAALVWTVALVGYTRLRRQVARLPQAEEGPLRVAVEAARLAIASPGAEPRDAEPELRVGETAAAPFLLGLLRPRIVLPAALVERLSPEEMRGLLAHELLHWRRRDTWVAWWQLLVQGLFWFHPLVWWAARQLRHERECVCDESVLRHNACDPETYGEAIVHTLTATRGVAPATATLVGVFEEGSPLQQRLEKVMSYSPEKRRFGWPARLALAAFAVVVLPMATNGQGDAAATAEPAAAIKSPPRSPFPLVVATSPEKGATGVDPGVDEIRVTFDREMGGGMSWTGDGKAPEFPTIDESRRAEWVDDRTCVLPVRLTKGRFYRIGINSTSFQNFQSADGTPAAHDAIYFSTAGAKRSVARKALAPEIVALDPPDGAGDVDPSRKTISVTFRYKMGGGMSWVRAGGRFPASENGRAWWSKDGKTCTMPVDLAPGADYRLSLNGSHYVNFQSKSGVPLPPVAWSFSTRGE